MGMQGTKKEIAQRNKNNVVRNLFILFIFLINIPLLFQVLINLLYAPLFDEKTIFAIIWIVIFFRQNKSFKFKYQLTYSVRWLTAALMLMFLAIVTDLNFISWFAGAVSIYSFYIYFYGYKAANKFLPALILMLYIGNLNSPAANSFIDLNLRLFVTKAAAFIVSLFGTGAYSKGALIYTSKAYFVIDKSCSGLNNLVAITYFSFIWAYLKDYRLRMVLVSGLLGFLLALFSNLMRIVALSLVGYYAGLNFIEPGKFIHDFIGIFWFIVSLGMLVYFSDKVNKIIKDSR